MNQYIHCMDESNQVKMLNLTSNGVLYSLLPAQLHMNDPRPNPMSMDIELLKNVTEKEINGMSSARMIYIFKRTILLKLQQQRPLTQAEEQIIKIADTEIAFEEGRRTFNYGAPSRLSCLYLMEDTFDARIDLGNMFRYIFPKPRIVQVGIHDKMELNKFDYRWFEEYHLNPKNDFIKSYWISEPYEKVNPKWEYLLEGSITLTDIQEQKEIETIVSKKWPDEYQSIVDFRKQN